MELHMVFYRFAYGSFEDALDHPDGLVVLSFLYSVSIPILLRKKNELSYDNTLKEKNMEIPSRE